MLVFRKYPIAVFFVAVFLLTLGVAAATTINGLADLVLGRNTFTEDHDADARGLDGPSDIAKDTVSSRIYVADSGNHRVLWWNDMLSLINNDDADGVIGQADFTSDSVNGGSANPAEAGANVFNNPTSLAVDAAGNVWVADYNNHRILRFGRPTASGASANLVLGQADFLGRAANRGGSVGAHTLDNPFGVSVDATGNVWVADRDNHRILRYGTPAANGAAADLVLGQADFTHNSVNRGGTRTANSLYRPYGIKVDSAGNVWVADRYNHRVLRYGTPSANGIDADLVLGQADFIHNSYNRGGTVAANTLYYPHGIAIDASGSVWVADFENNRMLKYNTPGINGANADLVLGQADFTSRLSNRGGIPAANTLYAPSSAIVDDSGNLWVAESFNHRVIKFNTPTVNGEDADLVLGSSTFTDGAADSIGAGTLLNPYGVAVDTGIGRLYVADMERSRVLWWNNLSSLVNGKAADGVIGQADLNSGLYNRTGSVTAATAGTLFYPRGVAVDASGCVWIVDQSNNRILKFNRPVANGEDAVLVLGQADFTHNSANRGGTVSANTLNTPRSIALDASGNVWVADRTNHRVIRYGAPTANGADADLVLGQADFTHNTANRGGTVSANTFNYPQGLVLDAAGGLWVADGNNNRVLKYNTPATNGADADLVLGQADFTHNSANRGGAVSANTLYYPIGLVVDIYGSLWVADGNNNRALKYRIPTANGTDAALVLGQAGFAHNEADRGGTVAADSMETPAGIAVDASGNLWIADFVNSRVLKFVQPDEIAPQAPSGLTVQ